MTELINIFFCFVYQYTVICLPEDVVVESASCAVVLVVVDVVVAKGVIVSIALKYD